MISFDYKHTWLNGHTADLPNGKAVCVGKNYADHIKEMHSVAAKEPVLFLKPNTAFCSANRAIKVSHLTHLGSLHHELEIALLIGDGFDKNAPKNAIKGIGLGLDLTLRDVQTELREQGLPWERAKAFDGSCAISSFIEFHADAASNDIALDDISLELILNGHTQQSGNSVMMLHSIETLLLNISAVFSLCAGDVVLTGTPAGVGPLIAGDVISATLNEHLLIDNTSII